MRGPTERQREIAHIVERHHARTGMGMTVRELMKAIGCRSTNAASDHVLALERHGLIRRVRGRAAGILPGVKAVLKMARSMTFRSSAGGPAFECVVLDALIGRLERGEVAPKP